MSRSSVGLALSVTFGAFGGLVTACGGGGNAAALARPAPATNGAAATQVEEMVSPEAPRKPAADHHRDFVLGCGQRTASSPDYCECAWGELRKELSDEDLNARELDRAKLDKVKSRVLVTCASLVTEASVRADFEKACVGAKAELEPYCECTWSELRKRFSSAELGDEPTVAGERFRTARVAVTKTCGNKVPEGVSREAFLRTCQKDPADAQYCGCAWKELRRSASPGEIEAGTFDQKGLFAQFEKTCGKLRAPKTAP